MSDIVLEKDKPQRDIGQRDYDGRTIRYSRGTTEQKARFDKKWDPKH